MGENVAEPAPTVAPAREARSGGARLAVYFALLAAVQAGVMTGDIEQVLYDASLKASSHVMDVFWFWCARYIASLVSMLTLSSTALAVIAIAVRLARAASAGSARDPVIRLRDWLRQRPRLAAGLPWMPALLMVPGLVRTAVRMTGGIDAWGSTSLFVAPVALAALGTLTALAGRFALRSLDRVRDRAGATITAVERDETTFLAVAVTPRTQGAVLAMVLVTVAMIAGLSPSGHSWLRDTAHGLPIAAYVVGAIGAALWFRKASTIAVGRDGIFVRGTSKERFFAYQDFDEVRLAGVHFDFHRGGKRVLRLQLHGADDARAEALAERIRAALAASRRTDGAHLLAQSAKAGVLGRAVQGASDYRQPSISREQLWELVEGDATDAQARLAAATALASSGDSGERARLRVAAHQVADPKVRVALEELGDDEAAESQAAAPVGVRPLVGERVAT